LKHPRLVRAISRWDLTAAVVNGVIGSAIFSMPAEQARLTGSRSPVGFAVAGVCVLTIMLCFAEVASRFEEPGGPYLYAREAFGPFAGFQAGWLTFWIRVTAIAANLNVFTQYLAPLVPLAATPWGRAVAMALPMVVIAAINVAGVRQAAWTVDVFTAMKLAPLALLIVLGLPHVRGDVLASQAVADPDWTRAVLLLMFAYGGFEAPLIPASEVRTPRRDSGFALLAALAVIGSVYMLVQIVIVGTVPRVGAATTPVADAFALLLGPPGAVLASVAAMVSIWGYCTGTTLQSPRVLYAMAERGELPGIFARVHPRFQTPHVAILVYAALALALAVSGSFAVNAALSAIVRLVTYGLTCAALLVFRRRRPEEPPGFRLRGASVIAPAGILVCLWLLSTRSGGEALTLILLMALGFVLQRVQQRRRRAAPGV
jgi:amino acid transporter